MKIHVWCPGIDPQVGGIEGYSAAIVNALTQIGVTPLRVFAKNEASRTVRQHLGHGAEGFGVGSVPLRFRTAAFVALLAAHAIADRPDLIITTHLNFGPAAAWLKRRFGIPYWVSLHGIDAWGLRHAARLQALKSADLLLPVSGFTRDRVMREQAMAPERFRVLPNTFEPAAWTIGPKPARLLERYGLSRTQPVILTVGRLSSAERYKGQDRVLLVLKEVAKELENQGPRETPNVQRSTSNVEVGEGNSDVRYLIVGDGDDRVRLERIATEEGITEMVTFAGRIPQEELADHYRLCDVFAMPSTGEGFGIVFLEAMASGKPVIGGTRDAAVDALRGGELGLLVDPENPTQLRDAIISVLNRTSPHPLIFQPEELRAKVIEYFGFERFFERVSEMLKGLELKR